MAVDITALVKRRSQLLAMRTPNESGWIEIEELFCPRRSTLLIGAAPGQKLTSQQICAAGELAARDLATFLQGNLTNPAQRWLAFRMRQEELNASNAVQNYLEDTAQRFLNALNASNFIAEFGEWYTDFTTIATSATLMFERLGRAGTFGGFEFETLAPGAYTIAENAAGVVNTIFYDTVMSAGAAQARWGQAVGQEILEKAKEKPDDSVTISRAIYPRKNANGYRADSLGLPWTDCIFDAKGKVIIKEGGFRRFPAIVGRFHKYSGGVWGSGPAHVALGEMQSKNRTRELKLLSFALDAYPETYERKGGVVGGMIREPGARNFTQRNPSEEVMTLTSGARFDVAALVEEDMKKTIERCFFVDQIRALPPADKPTYMTAYEVAKRFEETARLLGPAFGQLIGPLAQLVETGVAMMAEAEALMQMPEELRSRPDADVDLVFQGPLALAQKAADVQAIELESGWAAQMIQNVPQAASLLDNYDLDWLAQHKASVRGVPARGMRGREVVTSIRQQRDEAAAKQAHVQAMMATAQAAGQAAPMVKALQPTGQGAPAGG